MRVMILWILTIISVSLGYTANIDINISTREAAEFIDKNIDDPKTQEVIDSITVKISNEVNGSIDSELVLLMNVVNFDILHDKHLENTSKLIGILDKKHSANNPDRMQLLIFQIILYRDINPIPDKLSKVVIDTEKLRIDLQNREAVSNLTQAVELGEAYRIMHGGDRPETDRDSARKYFNEVINFPIFSPIYEQNYGVLKKVYLRAAIGLVKNSTSNELKQLWIFPFANQEIKRLLPDKSKQINTDIDNIIRQKTEGTVSEWLRARIKDNAVDEEMLSHFKAVLKYITPN